LFPELKQANRVIWKGIDKDGKRFLDHFPKDLIKGRPNNADMTIEFKNGSIFKLCGSDRYDSLMGSNPIGIVFSEYALQNPVCWDLMQPILAENGGWALFNYTPRGKNHGYELYQQVKKNEKWFTQLLDVTKTKRLNGEPVINKEAIEEAKENGMDDDLIQQEFYCSFTAAVKGSYFTNQLKLAEEEGRIGDFAIDISLPVSTFWDIGVNDLTAIWFVQPLNFNEFRLINYYENCGEGMTHYINYVYDFRNRYNFVYNGHYMPHDIGVTEWGTGKTRYMMAKEAGLAPITKIPRIKHKIDAIEMARVQFSKFFFHETKCKRGLRALYHYAKKYNEVTKLYSDQPDHTWASNGADAFLQICQHNHKIFMYNKNYNVQYTNRVNQRGIL
jgi:hypothetical protein